VEFERGERPSEMRRPAVRAKDRSQLEERRYGPRLGFARADLAAVEEESSSRSIIGRRYGVPSAGLDLSVRRQLLPLAQCERQVPSIERQTSASIASDIANACENDGPSLPLGETEPKCHRPGCIRGEKSVILGQGTR
jgi:hypothetical protein